MGTEHLGPEHRLSEAVSTDHMPLDPVTSNVAGNFGPTPSQTVGPYFHQGLVDFQGMEAAARGDLTGPDVGGSNLPGERITVTGRVLDADGETVEDALIEFWQADAGGTLASTPGAAFPGFARVHTRTPGHAFTLRTVKPGATGENAPHLNVWLGLRGLLTHLITRVYFEGDDHAADPVLKLVPEARRETLIARREETPDGPLYRLDIRLQGPQETVFFDAY
ncbi:protocatechuate 3,4-dioxygenase subunit alpha [Deinococcus sp.]|uniref:protocatechuate 3,4-dioxygenase subunit alpha n=1 Tax=Deinococcus sp. TaxID=47478 RepID=UPI002869B08B|nr:protocatechuate 3,4-dioxygenase subunit alpha [Deinococcus sp.]